MSELNFKPCATMLDLDEDNGIVGLIKIKKHNILECLDGNHRLRAILELKFFLIWI